MKKTAPWIVALSVLLGSGIALSGLGFAGGERPDCPGKIICPITGEEVCADRCPLGPEAAKSAAKTAAGSCCERS
ncbi:MAG: hypothetical protein HY721_16215 [Planctomycetes bacterium]|nr:hypothetical protein [Planctomycetota bacterium]